MKVAILAVLFIAASSSLFSQENKTFEINSMVEATESYKSEYLHPSFKNGKVIFMEGDPVEAKLNFNRLSNQLFFLSPKGDTLVLAHPETTSKVVIGADTFCFYQNTFLQKITHYKDAPHLFFKQTIQFVGSEKKGAYGTYSAVTSNNSNSTYTNDNQITAYLSVDENQIYKERTEFYLSDNSNHFFSAKKSGFYSMFPQYEDQLKTFFKTNKINFDKTGDLLQVILYIHSLNAGSSASQ